MQKHLCGREQEFGIGILPPLELPAKKSSEMCGQSSERETFFTNRCREIIGVLLSEIVSRLDSFRIPWDSTYPLSYLWLGNGSLFYIDSANLEAASAESLAGTFDNLLQEKASELIINEAIKATADKCRLATISFYKNNVGPGINAQNLWNEVTYGSHHNYSYLAAKKHSIYNLLTSFLPASLLLSGSGHIEKDSYGACYLLSQRAPHIEQVVGSETTLLRPLINTRPEALMADQTGLGRLHLISRDATRCEFQTWLVDSITHLVLRLAEEGPGLPREQRLRNPLRELHNINSSLADNLDYKVELGPEIEGYEKSCGTMDLLAYNYLFLNAAKQLSPLSDAEKKGLQEWQRVLELLKARAFDKLVGELDWVTKWWLLKKKMKQHDFGLDDIRAWKINLSYHNISPSPKESQFARLDEDGYIKHLVSLEEIKKAKTTAPETRAKSRGEFIKLCLKYEALRQRVSNIAWNGANIKEDPSGPAPAPRPSPDGPPEYYHGGHGHHGPFIPYETHDVYFGEIANPFTPRSSTLKKLYDELGIKDPID